jgi:hypothetical protein
MEIKRKDGNVIQQLFLTLKKHSGSYGHLNELSATTISLSKRLLT